MERRKKKMKSSIMKIMLPLLVAAPILAGCSGGGSDGSSSIDILIWDDATNLDFIEEKMNVWLGNFKQQYPDAPEINITYEEQGEAAAISDLLTVGESGNGPDLLAITSDTLSTGVNADLLAPITHAAEVEYVFDEKAASAATINGTVYAYPITSESHVIMYDKTQVSDPSIFDSFESLLASDKLLCWDTNDKDSAYYMFAFLTDAVLFGDDGTDPKDLSLTGAEGVANYTSLLKNYKDAIYPANPVDAVNYIEGGSAVGAVTTPFLYSQLENALGEGNVGMHVLPTIDGNTLRPLSGYKQYVISKYSKYPSIANDIAQYLTSSDVQADRLYEMNYLPTRYDGDILEVLAENGLAEVYQASYDNSIAMPSLPQMGYYWTPMINFCKAVWNESNPTEDTVRSGLEEVETTILNG